MCDPPPSSLPPWFDLPLTSLRCPFCQEKAFVSDASGLVLTETVEFSRMLETRMLEKAAGKGVEAAEADNDDGAEGASGSGEGKPAQDVGADAGELRHLPPCVWLAPCSCFWTVLQHTLATQAWLQYYIICDPALATAIHYLRPRLGYSTT